MQNKMVKVTGVLRKIRRLDAPLGSEAGGCDRDFQVTGCWRSRTLIILFGLAFVALGPNTLLS